MLRQLDDIITKSTPDIVRIAIISSICKKGGKEDPVNRKSFSVVSGENNAAHGGYFQVVEEHVKLGFFLLPEDHLLFIRVTYLSFYILLFHAVRRFF